MRPIDVRGATHPRAWPSRATFIPLFDHRGQSRLTLLADERAGGLWLAQVQPGSIRIPWFGGARIGPDCARPEPWAPEHAPDLAGLWHHDPWWLLHLPAFQHHPATDALELTNCAAACPDVRVVYYGRDLTGVRWVMEASGDEVRMAYAYDSANLPRHPSPDPPTRERGWRPALWPEGPGTRWRLAPRWAKATSRRR